MRRLTMPLAALAGVASALLVGGAAAATFTLEVAKNAKVTNQHGVTTREAIVVGVHRRAVYILTGDSKRHPKCTAKNGCFMVWPPVTLAHGKKPTAAPGIKGRLGVWRRDGFSQVVWNGHPLYYFSGDTRPADATGEGIVSFHGTWHVVKADVGGGGSSGGTTTTSSPTTPTTTTPCTTLYCY